MSFDSLVQCKPSSAEIVVEKQETGTNLTAHIYVRYEAHGKIAAPKHGGKARRKNSTRDNKVC